MLFPMSKGKLIKLIIVLVSLCLGLWQASEVVEWVLAARSRQAQGLPMDAPTDLLQRVNGGTADHAKIAALLTQHAQQTAGVVGTSPLVPPAAKPREGDDIRVFSPNGHVLTNTERERLLKEALRQQPRPKR